MEEYLLVSFSNGELTPKVNGRTDIKAYKNGGSTIKNFIVEPQGPIIRRPGSELMAIINTGARLIEFEGTDNLGYILAFTDLELRVFKDGVWLTGLGTAGVITTTFTTAIIPEMQYVIDGNKMYFVHNTIVSQILTYVTTPDFTFAAYTLSASVPGGWDTGDFTTAGNYPGSIALYEGRLLFGDTVNNPDHIWGSKVKLYNTFTEETTLEATDAFEIKINAKKGPRVNWMVGARGVFVGTDRGVFSVSDENNLLSPVSLITAKQNSSYPASDIPGFMLGGELFYTQVGNRKIRMALYDLNQDQYMTPDITSASEHITIGLIKEIAVQTLPETIVWVVTESGELLTYSYNRENQISAWTRHETLGDYKSVAVVREGSIETVYVVVEREGVGYLERFQPIEFTDNNYVYLDHYKTTVFDTAKNIATLTWSASDVTVVTSVAHGLATDDYVKVMGTGVDGIDYTVFKINVSDTTTFTLLDELMGSPIVMASFTQATTGTIQKADLEITGYDHLQYQTVTVVSAGKYIGEYTVTALGHIVMDERQVEFTAGHNFISDLIPMNIDIQKNKKKRIVRLSIEVLNSMDGKAGKDADNLDDLVYETPITMDLEPELFTGTVAVSHRGGHEFNGDILIRQDQPMPLTIMSLTARVEVD